MHELGIGVSPPSHPISRRKLQGPCDLTNQISNSLPMTGVMSLYGKENGTGGCTYCLELGTLWGLRAVRRLRRGPGRAL